MTLIRSLALVLLTSPIPGNAMDEEDNAGIFASAPREIVDEILSYLVSSPKDLSHFSQTCKYLRGNSYQSRSRAKENWLMLCGQERPELPWDQYYLKLSSPAFLKPIMEKTILNYARFKLSGMFKNVILKFTGLDDDTTLMESYKNLMEFVTILYLPNEQRGKLKDSQGHHFIENEHDLRFYNYLIFTSAYKKDELGRPCFELSQIASNVDFCKKFVTQFPQLSDVTNLITQENCYEFMLSLKRESSL